MNGHLNLKLSTGLTLERKMTITRNGINLKVISFRAALVHEYEGINTYSWYEGIERI
jgi:uncharacterized protein YutE (UPF0331/DUF86 family)